MLAGMRRIALLSIVSASGLFVAPAAAQELADRNVRLAGNLALGLAGEVDTYVESSLGTARGEVDLEPSVGFDLRVEAPVLDFLVIGGWFEMLTIEQDTSGAEREETVSFDGYVRGRWVFAVADDQFFIEPYVLLPLGFSAALLPDSDASGDDDTWLGWNTGAFFGSQFLHASGFGGYVEVGWRHAEVYEEHTVLGGDVKGSLVLNEMALNFGFVYAFGD